MKLFFRKILFYALLVIVLCAVAELLLRKIPNNYSMKDSVYKKNAEKIQVLILGSSYGLYDLDPRYFDLYAFNGSGVLQSVDLDKKIFDKFEKRMSRLKYIVMPVTFASFFFKLETSGLSFLSKNYSIYYGVHSTNDLSNYFEILNLPFSVNRTRLVDYYIHHKNDVTVNADGFDSTYYSRANSDSLSGPTAQKALKDLEIKDFSKFDEQKDCLDKMIIACAARNIKLILFTPPAYKTFYSASDTAQLYSSIRTCQFFRDRYANVRYYNFLKDTSFSETDYYDISHLNLRGAEKLSLKMNDIIKSEK